MEHITETLIKIILGVFGGGSIAAAYYQYIINKKQHDSSEAEKLYLRLNSDNERLRTREQELEDEIEELQTKVLMLERGFDNLKSQFNLLKHSDSIGYFATIIEDSMGKVVMVNNEYQERILTPLGLKTSDYFGKTAVEFWGNDLGAEYMASSKEVMLKKTPIDAIQRIKRPDKLDKWRVVKIPVHLSNTDILVGVKVIWIHPI